jgi:hypothetical protein
MKNILKNDQPRIGWEEQFKLTSVLKDDYLLISDIFEDETFEKWN